MFQSMSVGIIRFFLLKLRLGTDDPTTHPLPTGITITAHRYPSSPWYLRNEMEQRHSVSLLARNYRGQARKNIVSLR
jgi:hypothetical protein